MAVAARQPRAARRARPASRQTAPRTRPQAGRHVAGGVVWIVVVAVLLAGIVALNVAVLRTNLRIDDLGQQEARLRAENAGLETKLAARAAMPRIEQEAARALGLGPAQPDQKIHIDLRR